MSNSRKEIPQWTWYNGQFLFQFDEQLNKNPKLTIPEFFDNFLKSQQLQKLNIYHTKNQETIILLMYGLLVIPKEIWKQKTTSFSFDTRSKFSVILPTDNSLDTLNFLRLLRISLAHANFSIDINNEKLTFWNSYKGTQNFKVQINYSDLREFLTEVGQYYINEVKNTQQVTY